nr:glycosyl hydrolase family 28-related protein [uncultured Sphingomonas sp.]
MAYVTDSNLEATGVSQGANMVGFVQNDSGAVSRTTMEKLRETVSVLDFGATGNGTTDDYPAIQAALTWVGDHGGGTVFLPPTFSGRYRITQGLKIPSHVTLCGCAPARYPFNAGNLNSSALYADFGDPFQWIVEADTQDDNGDPIPYNVLLSSALPLSRNITANICVKHLIITADPNKAIPYGGIRMHGCPGAIIEDVSVDIASCGALVNCCFDPRVSIHVQTPNYGLVVYDVNAGVFDLYAGGTDGGNKFVQAEYILPHMSLINGAIIPAFKLKTEDHYKRKWV